ncbi:MAG: GFA family protein [Pseudomonadota bacterium]
MAKIEGHCLCGQVRYRADAEPAMVVNCYCEACRRNTGGTHSYNIAMPAGSVTIEGASLRTYLDRSGASGQAFERLFCGDCGSPIMGRGPAYEGLEFLKAGTLDDAGGAEPAAHIWCEEKLSWIALPKGATAVPRNL